MKAQPDPVRDGFFDWCHDFVHMQIEIATATGLPFDLVALVGQALLIGSSMKPETRRSVLAAFHRTAYNPVAEEAMAEFAREVDDLVAASAARRN